MLFYSQINFYMYTSVSENYETTDGQRYLYLDVASLWPQPQPPPKKEKKPTKKKHKPETKFKKKSVHILCIL